MLIRRQDKLGAINFRNVTCIRAIEELDKKTKEVKAYRLEFDGLFLARYDTREEAECTISNMLAALDEPIFQL